MLTGFSLRRVASSLRPTEGILARAQAVELNNQIPLAYLVLNSNAVLLAATHLRCAPPLLSAVVPAIVVLLGLLRAFLARRRASLPVSTAEAGRRLRAADRLACLYGLLGVCWAWSLMSYGGADERAFVVVYVAITMVAGIFCLRYAPRAAALFGGCVAFPFAVLLLAAGAPALRAVAADLIVVGTCLLLAVLMQFADFADLVASREDALLRQAELERLSDDNHRLANLDSLTLLPNRRSFLAALEATLEDAVGERRRFAVAMVDLDGFKTVNDVHGHAAGDRLLVEAAGRLRELEAADVFFARLGGDEFAAICVGDRTDAEFLGFAELICRALRGSYLDSEIPAFVSGSAGIVIYPEGAQTAANLFERADFALYHAKQSRKGGAVLFSATHESMIREASLLEHALEQADLEREMELVFQPIVAASSGTLTGFEALARWRSPLLGPVRPDLFIPAAERARVIGRLTEVLFAKAMAAASAWPETVRIAFNLSALDVENNERVDALLRRTAEAGVSPGRVDLEITETAMMRDLPKALGSIGRLREAGFQISLDDFGTGYSSLSQLHVLKPDKVKIDRSFMADLGRRPEATDIVRSAVELCRNLRLATVVEGVETTEQAELLRDFGCSLMQGYLFGRPMDFSEASRLAGGKAEAEAAAGRTRPASPAMPLCPVEAG